MTPVQILNLFNKIENECATEKLVYKGIDCWPLIRCKLGFELFYNQTKLSKIKRINKISKLSLFTKIIYYSIKIGFYYLKFILRIKRIKGKNWIIAFKDDIFIDNINGLKYNRYIDPYYEQLNSLGCDISRVTLNTLHDLPCTGKEYYHKAFVVNFLDLQKIYFCMQFIKNNLSYKKDLINAKNILLKVIRSDRKLLKSINLSYFNLFEGVKMYEFCFNTLFYFTRPKNIFLQCYYDDYKMGLIVAAKKHKIKTIEIQHGGIEDFMYVPFKKSCNTIPDYIWCWSKQDLSIIQKFNGSTNFLKPFVGGNAWYNKNIKNQSREIKNLDNETIFKTILITLQYKIGYINIFEEVIKYSPNDYTFLVRFHPLMTPTEREEYLSKLSLYKNVDFNCNNSLNIFECYQKVKFHLTHSSTTAAEAINFKVQTILVSKFGYEYFRDMVNSGVIKYMEDPKQIVKVITDKNNCLTETAAISEYRIGIDDTELKAVLKNEKLY